VHACQCVGDLIYLEQEITRERSLHVSKCTCTCDCRALGMCMRVSVLAIRYILTRDHAQKKPAC